jgi:hypothetical protein
MSEFELTDMVAHRARITTVVVGWERESTALKEEVRHGSEISLVGDLP